MNIKTEFDPQKALRLLKDQGRKIKWLAEECDCSPEHMSLVLNGHRIPSEGTIKLIALALGTVRDAVTKGRTKAKAS